MLKNLKIGMVTMTLAYIFIFAESSMAGEVVLTMRDRAFIDSPKVKLSDLVKSFSGNQAEINLIKDFVVLDVGGSIQYKRIDNNLIKNVIEVNAKHIKPIFHGALNTYVKLNTQTIDLTETINKIQQSITKKLSKLANKYSVTISGAKHLFMAPRGKYEIKYRLPEEVAVKRLPVWVDVRVNEEHYRSTPLWFIISVYADVPVAARRLEHGQRLSKDMIKLVTRDIAKYKNPALTENGWENLRTIRQLEEGQVITASSIEELPMVYTGQRVKIISKQGNVQLVLNGIAIDDGTIGDTVRIRRLGAAKPFIGIVADKGTVTAIGGEL